PQRVYADLREYLRELDGRGLLTTVAEPVDKDNELVPLVRLQFRGLDEPDRRAFLFTDVTDARQRRFDASVAIGTFGECRAVYAAALGLNELDEVGATWARAL